MSEKSPDLNVHAEDDMWVTEYLSLCTHLCEIDSYVMYSFGCVHASVHASQEAAEGRTVHSNGWNGANRMASNTWKPWKPCLMYLITLHLFLRCHQSPMHAYILIHVCVYVCMCVCVYVPVHAYSVACVRERGIAGIMLVDGNPQREVTVGHGLQRLNYTAWWVPLSVTPLAESKHTNKILCLKWPTVNLNQGLVRQEKTRNENNPTSPCVAAISTQISSGFRYRFQLY